jgi:formylglycine-generating enzyme required for sulfatase activity
MCLLLAGCGQPATEPARPDPGSNPASLAGFRADAWFMPDAELLGFVEVPSGPFLMGSDPAVDPQAYDNERWSAEAAQGTLHLPTFFIARTEVTVAQYRSFVEETGATFDAAALRAPPDHPVSSISWPDALAWCRWLEAKLRDWPGTPPAIARALAAGWRVTLPSEAQWEKAARGTHGRVFPWGETARRDRANFLSAGTTPVASFVCPECPFGLADMAGNLWELTRSRYDPYPYDPTDEQGRLSEDALFVMRGGHFGDTEQNVRAAVRGGVDPGARRAFIGFRVVISQF